jgi:hypothetical protein
LSDQSKGISKAGNRKGRTTGIELAWLWLRYQPDSDLSVWFRARVGTVKGRIRRIAIVALARKLLVALWRYLETGLVPRGAVLKGANPATGLDAAKLAANQTVNAFSRAPDVAGINDSPLSWSGRLSP